MEKDKEEKKDKKEDKEKSDDKEKEAKDKAVTTSASASGSAATPATTSAEKEEFRSYLKRSGIIDTLTKILTQLYDSPARPEDTNIFLKEHLGPLVNVDIVKLEKENKELREKLEAAQKQIEKLDKSKKDK